MAFISFTKSADLEAPDDLRINSTAVLYIEASRPELMGRTMIHMLGQGALVNAVMESSGTVITALSGEKFNLVECTRHYLATPPHDGPSTVYISAQNVSYVRPNLPISPFFWVVTFIDGSDLRIMAPLPHGL